MGKTDKINWAKLKEPFPENDIEWRVQRAGESKGGKEWAIVVPYITARGIMERLDEVVGPENWKNDFVPAPSGGILCGISIRVSTTVADTTMDEWVCKWDGAENTNIEAVKGGLSGAMKRAAVQWGMGRYLYGLEEGFAIISEKGKLKGSFKDTSKKTHYFNYDPPMLPDWALPESERPPSLEEVLLKIEEAKALKHLSNIWAKYKGFFKGEYLAALVKAKDERKTELTKEG